MRVVVTHSGSGSLLAADFASQLLNVVQHLIICPFVLPALFSIDFYNIIVDLRFFKGSNSKELGQT